MLINASCHVFSKTRQVRCLGILKSFIRYRFVEMPKNWENEENLRRARQKHLEKNEKKNVSYFFLEFVGSGAIGAPRSLFVFTDNQKYLFNCGEGTQRLANEHKFKIAQLQHVFITYPCWENIGGLPGMALTIQDAGTPEIIIHGPFGTDRIFKATKKFIVLQNLSTNMAVCSEDTVFDDGAMIVNYVLLHKKVGSIEKSPEINIEDDDTDYYSYELDKNKNKKPKLDVVKSDEELTITGPVTLSMSYICKLRPKPGTLDFAACVDRGVPPGPLLGKLKNGVDITLPDGTFIKSSEVTNPEEPGPVFVVVECPSLDFLDSLLESEKFKKHQIGAESEDDIARIVVHFTPSSVMEHERYQIWMRKFPDSTKHVTCNENSSCLGSVAVHEIQEKLHLVEPNIFPPLRDTSIPIVETSDTDNILNDTPKQSKEESDLDTGDTEAVYVPTGPEAFTFRREFLRPLSGVIQIHRKSRPEFNRKAILNEIIHLPEFEEQSSVLKTRLQSFGNNSNQYGEYPKVLFLGTGSSVPNKSRNTSGILLTVSPSVHALLDCGEGTAGQMVRFFGLEEAFKTLANLNVVYISHLHADHHIGLIGLLKMRQKAFERLRIQPHRLLLLAPEQIINWIKVYHYQFENVMDYFHLVPNAILNYKEQYNHTKTISSTRVFESLSMRRIETTPVIHCPNSFGVTFTHKDGWRITYSGDTMPCKSLIDMGNESDLLIHEATMEDDLANEARLKMHCTISQAIRVGSEMKAKFTLLTHFSQRYSKVPTVDNIIADNDVTDKVGIAFDNMIVSLNDLKKLPLFYPLLKVIFAEHIQDLEYKKFKRQKRLEYERSCQA